MSTPDVEAIVCGYLRTALSMDRVGTRTPPSTALPWLRVTLIDDSLDAKSSAERLVHAYLQIDCYGSSDRDFSSGEARDLARAARSALRVIQAASLSATFTGATGCSIRPLPDSEFTPARERYVLTATLHLHS